MAVFHIPTIIPLVWALLVAIFWRFRFGDPVNHWLVCVLVFAINFFFFAYAFIAFVLIAIWTLDIFKSKKDKK